MPKEKNTIGDESCAKHILDFFLKSQSSYYSFSEIRLFLSKSVTKNADKFRKFIDKYGKKSKRGHVIPLQYGVKAEKLLFELQKARTTFSIVPPSLFTTMVENYDALITNILKALILNEVKLLKNRDKNIAFDKLLDFSSISKLREYMLENSIFSFTSMSHIKQIKWLEKKFKLDILNKLVDIELFTEATMRRNIYVHGNGVVSKDYFNFCKEKKIKTDAKIGEQLILTSEYFKRAYHSIVFTGVVVACEIWRKALKEEIHTADFILNDEICFRLLKNEEYELAAIILDYATSSIDAYADELARITYIVNKAISYKFSGKGKEAIDLLDSLDRSAWKDSYQLAYHVLTDDFDTAANYMKVIGTKGGVAKSDYLDWPLFVQFRKSKKFIKTYKAVFGEDFKLKE